MIHSIIGAGTIQQTLRRTAITMDWYETIRSYQSTVTAMVKSSFRYKKIIHSLQLAFDVHHDQDVVERVRAYFAPGLVFIILFVLKFDLLYSRLY